MNEQQQAASQANGFWAIVEIFGHQRIAGFLSEQTIGGQSFVRVDVPELPAGADEYSRRDGPIAAHSKLFGGGAIYAITPVDETIARISAQSIRHKPVTAYGVAEALKNMSQEHRTRLLTNEAFGDDVDRDDNDFR